MIDDALWRFASASVIGTSHVKTGSPCQDSHACRVFTDRRGEPILSLAVSDGAGSAAHSDLGATLTCSTLLEQVEVFLGEGGIVSALTEGTVSEWLKAVREVIADHAGEHSRTMRDYACTLLFAAISPDCAVFGQVGDGAIITANAENSFHWVFWPDRGEFANTTYFVTDDTAVERLRLEFATRRVDEVALLSDGIEALVLHYATRSVHIPFFDRMFPPIRRSNAVGQDLDLSHELEAYLNSPSINQRTDDDKTLVLASRLRLSVDNVVTEREPISAPVDGT